MEYTTQVHSYTMMIPMGIGDNFYHFSILSVEPIDMEAYLKGREKGSKIVDNGMINASPVSKTHSPWNTTTFGYKMVHTSRNSRGEYAHDVYVPENWDENHPKMKEIRNQGKQENENQNHYYSRPWV